MPETLQRPRAMPRYREFMRDTQQIAQGVIVGSSDWEQILEATLFVLPMTLSIARNSLQFIRRH